MSPGNGLTRVVVARRPRVCVCVGGGGGGGGRGYIAIVYTHAEAGQQGSSL